MTRSTERSKSPKIKKCEIKNIKGYGQTNNSYLCDELSKLIFTGALALVGRVT
jgi:hypothetical protein